MIKYLSYLLFGAALLFPGSALAANIPAPVIDALEAFESGEPYRSNAASVMKISLFGVTLTTDTTMSSFTDASGNTGGKMTMKASVPDEGEFTLVMEYAYFAADDAFYARVTKHPEDKPDSMRNLKKGTWYKTTLDNPASLIQAMGQTELTTKDFLKAQSKYPVFTFTEKGSTKKEYVYAYTVNDAMFESFVTEQARLSGATLTPAQIQLSSARFGAFKGTLTVNKKTLLPSKQTQRIGSSKDAMHIVNTITYKFGGAGNVKRPTKAVEDGVLIKSLFPTL